MRTNFEEYFYKILETCEQMSGTFIVFGRIKANIEFAKIYVKIRDF